MLMYKVVSSGKKIALAKRGYPVQTLKMCNDNGVYRFDKYSAIKLASGEWSSNYGYLIGKIVPGEGLLPNKRYQKELAEQMHKTFPGGITDVASGQYAFILKITQDVLEQLKACFLPDGPHRSTVMP